MATVNFAQFISSLAFVHNNSHQALSLTGNSSAISDACLAPIHLLVFGPQGASPMFFKTKIWAGTALE